MRHYEIMFITRPTLSDDETKKTVDSFKKIITDNKAKITEEKSLGKRELAYEIKDFKSGTYFTFEVQANDDKAIKEFDRLALISKDIIRHLITKIEK